MSVVVVFSGGIDSTTLVYDSVASGRDTHLLSFDYGQRHREKELTCARTIALMLQEQGKVLSHHTIDLRPIKALLTGNALTDESRPVPHGHYAAPMMSQTVVPNRNAIMLSVAYGHAVSVGASAVLFGAHAGDHPIYPDCRSEFVSLLESAFMCGTDSKVRIVAPFIMMNKAQIVARGAALGVPFDRTWSCYEGGAVHCGRCGTCVERQEAFSVAGISDPTTYSAAGVAR